MSLWSRWAKLRRGKVGETVVGGDAREMITMIKLMEDKIMQ